jgi:hypothetical protein
MIDRRFVVAGRLDLDQSLQVRQKFVLATTRVGNRDHRENLQSIVARYVYSSKLRCDTAQRWSSTLLEFSKAFESRHRLFANCPRKNYNFALRL